MQYIKVPKLLNIIGGASLALDTSINNDINIIGPT